MKCQATNGPGTWVVEKSDFKYLTCYCAKCNVAQARQTVVDARAAGAAKIGDEERKYKRPALKAYRPLKLEKTFVGLHSFQRMIEAYCGDNETAYTIHKLMIARNEEEKRLAA